MAAIRMYTTQTCPYCVAAKRFLRDRKQVAFDEIDVGRDPGKRRWLVEATGMTTVPQIFIVIDIFFLVQMIDKFLT